MVEPRRANVGPVVARSVVMAIQHSPSDPRYPQENIPWRDIIARNNKPGQALWWLMLLLAIAAALVLIVIASAGPGMRSG